MVSSGQFQMESVSSGQFQMESVSSGINFVMASRMEPIDVREHQSGFRELMQMN